MRYSYPLQQSGLLAKVGNPWAIVVREHFVTKDGVSDLWGVHEVHLEETRLQMTLLRLVLLESIEQE